MFCADCGTKVEEGTKFCSSCGKAVSGVSNEPVAAVVQQQPAVMQAQPLMADEMYCSSCGAVIKKIAEICPKCGVPNSAFANPKKRKYNFSGGSLGLGILGIILPVLPIVGSMLDHAPPPYELILIHPIICIGGLIYAILGLKSSKKRGMAVAGLTLSIVGLVGIIIGVMLKIFRF